MGEPLNTADHGIIDRVCGRAKTQLQSKIKAECFFGANHLPEFNAKIQNKTSKPRSNPTDQEHERLMQKETIK